MAASNPVSSESLLFESFQSLTPEIPEASFPVPAAVNFSEVITATWLPEVSLTESSRTGTKVCTGTTMAGPGLPVPRETWITGGGGVAVGVTVGVLVGVSDGVRVAVFDIVKVVVRVGLSVGVGVAVLEIVSVGVAVGLSVGVDVGDAVGLLVAVEVRVAVGVRVGVFVAVEVGVKVLAPAA